MWSLLLLLAAAEPQIVNPDWIDKPSGDDISEFFPKAAAAKGVDGRAVIRCVLGAAEGPPERCEVISEEPPHEGFGDAALKVATRFKLSPKKVDGVGVAGGTVRVPLVFKVPHRDNTILAGLPEIERCLGVAVVQLGVDPSEATAEHYLDWFKALAYGGAYTDHRPSVVLAKAVAAVEAAENASVTPEKAAECRAKLPPGGPPQ